MKKNFVSDIKNNTVANCKISNPLNTYPSNLFNFLTLKVLKLYEKNSDIKKYKSLVLQGNIDKKFLDETEKEFKQKGIFDPFNEENIKALADNERLLNDLTPNSD